MSPFEIHTGRYIHSRKHQLYNGKINTVPSLVHSNGTTVYKRMFTNAYFRQNICFATFVSDL